MNLDRLYADFAIIGGGIIGMAAAYFLTESESGPSVTVLEAGTVGGQASGVNAGTLSLQNKHPLLTPLCLKAHRLWSELERTIPGGLEFLPKGGLCVAQTEEEEGELADRYAVRREAGLPLSWLDRGELAARFPWLSGSVRAATFNPLDAQASPLRVTSRLMKAATERGVRVLQHCPALSAEPEARGWLLATPEMTLRAETVIVAAGGWSDVVGGYFGCRIPVERKVPQLAITDELPFRIPQVLIHVNGRLSLKQYPNGRAMIGGGWEGTPADADHRRTMLRLESVAGNLALAASVVPGLSSAQVMRLWSGMEGMSPDRLPYLGAYPGKPNLLFAVEGFGGFTLGIVFAKMAIDLLLGQGERLPEWVAPDRYDHRSTSHHK